MKINLHRIVYNVFMAQVTIYLSDEVEARARKVAKARGTSLGRWIAERVAENVNSTWPPEVLAAIGAFPDFPEEAEIRSGYGADVPQGVSGLTLLDTNIIIYCLKGREPAATRFRAAIPSEIAIPSVVAYELEYGTLKISSPQRRKVLSQMLAGMEEVPFDREAARASARLRVDLERHGVVIGPLDLLIAGTVLSRGAALATNNTREFSRIKGLRLEDWTSPA